MKILVTGAEGSLASNLIPKLIENEYEVLVSDTSDTHWNVQCINTNPDEHEPSYLTDLKHVIPADVSYKIKKREIDCIIHCAEDTIPSLDTRIVYTNMYYTAEVLKACAETGIRCIVPTWEEFNSDWVDINDTLWKNSIRYKKKLVSFYNIGNAVINIINIPRIILGGMHPDIYGNLCGRFYDCVCNGKLFTAYSNEFGFSKYTRINSVIDSILRKISIKTRQEYIVTGRRVEDTDLISYLLYIFDLPSIDIYVEKNEPQTINRPKTEPSDNLVCIYLKKAISSQFDNLFTNLKILNQGGNYGYRT